MREEEKNPKWINNFISLLSNTAKSTCCFPSNARSSSESHRLDCVEWVCFIFVVNENNRRRWRRWWWWWRRQEWQWPTKCTYFVKFFVRLSYWKVSVILLEFLFNLWNMNGGNWWCDWAHIRAFSSFLNKQNLNMRYRMRISWRKRQNRGNYMKISWATFIQCVCLFGWSWKYRLRVDREAMEWLEFVNVWKLFTFHAVCLTRKWENNVFPLNFSGIWLLLFISPLYKAATIISCALPSFHLCNTK